MFVNKRMPFKADKSITSEEGDQEEMGRYPIKFSLLDLFIYSKLIFSSKYNRNIASFFQVTNGSRQLYLNDTPHPP